MAKTLEHLNIELVGTLKWDTSRTYLVWQCDCHGEFFTLSNSTNEVFPVSEREIDFWPDLKKSSYDL